jgi:hypothetical protein
MANLNFDATTVDPMEAFEPIPADKYLACIVQSEMKSTKSGKGSYLELTFEILEGQYKGRKVWTRLNLENSSPMAVKIARAELSAICRSAKVLMPRDSCELHNIPILVKIRLEKRHDTDELVNKIFGYSPRENTVNPPTPATSKTAPWQRG